MTDPQTTYTKMQTLTSFLDRLSEDDQHAFFERTDVQRRRLKIQNVQNNTAAADLIATNPLLVDIVVNDLYVTEEIDNKWDDYTFNTMYEITSALKDAKFMRLKQYPDGARLVILSNDPMDEPEKWELFSYENLLNYHIRIDKWEMYDRNGRLMRIVLDDWEM